LKGLLDALADPQRRSDAAVQLMVKLEGTRLGHDPACFDMVSEPLRVRHLEREEVERVAARVGEEMHHAARRRDGGLAELASTLTYADSELALPPLLEVLQESWKTAPAGDIAQVLGVLERVLWGVAAKPTEQAVEQVQAQPQLRKTLRRIARRRLDTGGERTPEIPGLIEEVDGYLATIRAPPELRPVRGQTFALRRNPERALAAMLKASGQPISRCVIASETREERENGELEVTLVLAPKGRTYRFETETADGGRLQRAAWTVLQAHQQPQHRPTIELLQRVRDLEAEERQQLGRIPNRGPRS